MTRPEWRGPGSPLDIHYDVALDQVTVDGQKFSGEFFRAFGLRADGEERHVRLYRDERGVVRADWKMSP